MATDIIAAINAAIKKYSGGSGTTKLYNLNAQDLLNQLKAKIANSMATTKQQLGQLPQQYQPMRDQSEVARQKELSYNAEMAANRGDNGGMGQMANLLTNTNYDNALNGISLQQRNAADAMNLQNTEAQNQGYADLGSIMAQVDENKLKAALAKKSGGGGATDADKMMAAMGYVKDAYGNWVKRGVQTSTPVNTSKPVSQIGKPITYTRTGPSPEAY